MWHRLLHTHAFALRWRHIWTEEVLAILMALVIFVVPVSATRLQERSLFMQDNEPGATTSYTISFRYMTPAAIGSIDLLFCDDPIPYNPCVTPAGLNVSAATLSAQSGVTGYTIATQSTNHLILSRLPSVVGMTDASYTLSNVHNPTDSTQAFSIRMRTHTTTNATGTQVDFGSVRGQVATGIQLETQVPPMLIFCLAQEVQYDCIGTNDTYYSDMGDMTPATTLTTQSQMAVGTNASGGFAITAYGDPPAAGTTVIDAPTTPTVSRPGTNQFGINLVENTAPAVGYNPEGQWANAVPSTDYGQTNRYKYVSGDVVAFSPNVSLMKKFTVSYILNSSKDLRAGVYTTTINFIASGRF